MRENEDKDYLCLISRLSELRNILRYLDSYDYNELGKAIEILMDKEKYNNAELMDNVKDYLSKKNFFNGRWIYDNFMPNINGKAWGNYICELEELCNKILFNKMKNIISIKNGKDYYIIKDEKQYTYIHDTIIFNEELCGIDDNKGEFYGVQEITISKIGNDQKNYFDKILNITSKWENSYNNPISEENQWSVKINYNDKELSFFGNNEHPENWNEFEDFLKYITNNQNDKLNKKITINMNNSELVENQNSYNKQLQYNLLVLCIYNVLLLKPQNQHTIFSCARLLNEEKSEIYSDRIDLLYIDKDEYIIKYFNRFFINLKNNNKELYHQIIEDVIKAVTYYCMRNSDQLINIPLETIKYNGINEIINLAQTIIDNE